MNIEAILQRETALFMDGLPDEAETVFQEVPCSKPEHYKALNNIGVSHNLGLIEQAEQLFLKALDVNGEYPDALSNLADPYQAANQNENALKCLEKLLIFQPNNCDLLNRLAFLYIKIKQEQTAISLINRSLKLYQEQETLKKTLSSLISGSRVMEPK
jgi:tetratricopeptide (TPR) repeat protein